MRYAGNADENRPLLFETCDNTTLSIENGNGYAKNALKTSIVHIREI